jgi:hypothetical protein
VRTALVLALALAGCSASGSYMGIDTSGAPERVLTPREQRIERERDALMLMAVLAGCYERVPGGFRTVPPERARSFACGARLAEIEMRSKALPSGRGPTGTEALDLSRLARMAESGDKRAQLELGIRFEEGIGLPVDFDRAARLYASAGSASGGTLWVYSPPVGNGTQGRVIPIDQGPRMPGLTEASERLEALESRRAILGE